MKIFVVIGILLVFIESKCRMQQDCDVRDPKCRPSAANNTDPQILAAIDSICPDYSDQLACCNKGQNILMRNNFDSLDSVFGSKYGGCDACAINLKKFWCHFTCSPDQDQWLNVGGYEDVVIDNVKYTLLHVNMTLNQEMNCQLFNSCKKTKYASQVAAMNNAIGFISFQGSEAYRKSPVFIGMDFIKEGGLKFDIRPCNTEPIDGKIDGFPAESSCKCNSCDKSCHYDSKATFPVLEGFSFLTVGMVYIFVAIFTGLIFLCKWYYRRKHPHFNSRSSSFDSNLLDHNNSASNSSNPQIPVSKNALNNVSTNLSY